MNIQLSDHFTYKKLLVFALPSICMMVFTSIYSVVDGFFVSNFIGKVPFAAVNFAMPMLMIIAAVGTVFGTGGSALVAKTLGEGDNEKANRLFTLFIVLPAIVGIFATIAGEIFLEDILRLMGAEGELLEYAVRYSRVSMLTMAPYMMQYAYQSFFVTAEKPQLGFVFTVVAGVTNMVLDAVFVVGFHWNVEGAALATCISECIGGIAPCIYFSRKNTALIKFAKPVFDLRAIGKAVTNGMSEFVSTLSMSLVGMVYNFQLLKYAGENGVAAYGVVMYVNFMFISIFLGYSIGTAPIYGYNYGAQNHDELKNLLRRSLTILAGFAVVLFALAEALAGVISHIFVGYDAVLMDTTITAFRIYSVSFLLCGFNIFGSAFFTALNNGLVSALISFIRTLVFEIGAVLLLPLIFGLDGIWSSIIVAEGAAMILTFTFIYANRKKYHYL